MRRLLTLTVFLTLYASLFAQTGKGMTTPKKPTSLELYKIFYEFKDYAPSPGELQNLYSQFNVYNFEQFRKQSEDVEIYLNSLDKTLVLYSVNRVQQIKAEKNVQF